MSTPRKKKSLRKDQEQKNSYPYILGENLRLVDTKDLATQEKRLSNDQDNNLLAGGRRSTDKDNEGLREYWDSLTEREQDVMIGVCKGLTDAEIGMLLGIGYPTVKSNIHRIFRTVNVRNRMQLMVRFRNFNFPRDISHTDESTNSP